MTDADDLAGEAEKRQTRNEYSWVAALFGSGLLLAVAFAKCPLTHATYVLHVTNRTDHVVRDLRAVVGAHRVVEPVPTVAPGATVDVQLDVDHAHDSGLWLARVSGAGETRVGDCGYVDTMDTTFVVSIDAASNGDAIKCEYSTLAGSRQ